MSWGAFFDQSGSYSTQSNTTAPSVNTQHGSSQFHGETYPDPDNLNTGGGYGQTKRTMNDENGYGSSDKRQKFESSGYSGQYNSGQYNESESNQGGYDDGGYSEGPSSWDMLKEPEVAKQEPVSWGDMSEITSWDQISSGKTSGGGGKARQGGGGWSAGGGSSREEDGQFGDNSDAGSGWGGNTRGGGGGYGGRGRGGGSGYSSNRGWGGGQSYGGGGQNYGGGGQRFGGGRGGGRGYDNRGRGGRGGFGGGRGGYFGGNSNLSLVEKFEKYTQFLKRDTGRINAIQSIENACTATALHLKCEYISDELPRIYHRLLFTGKLSISGIFLARTVGANKKDMKHEIYNKALETLKTKSMTDINDLKDPGVELVKVCVERYLKKQGPGIYKEGMGAPINQGLGDIVNEIKSNLESVHTLQMGLSKLMAYLKGPANMPDNPISKLEQAMIASRSGMRHIFQIEVRMDDDKPMFDGEFILEDTCIARATDQNKKTCKVNTYVQALEALDTKPVSELLVPVTKDVELKEEDHVHIEAIVSGVGKVDGEGPPPVVRPSLREAGIDEKLRSLNNVMSTSAYSESNMAILDNSVYNSGLTAMLIYRRADVTSEECASCEYYIENYLIAIGHGSTKSDCTTEAYNIAYDIVTTTSPADIMLNFRKIGPSETTGPTVLDVVVKGEKGLNKESNIAQLRRHGFDPDNDTRSLKDLVIVEAGTWHEDRKSCAFAILQSSALHNGMVLQWSFTHIRAPGRTNYRHEHKPLAKFRCQIFVKGQQVSEYTGYGKNRTRNYAATDILFHLYETNDVVRIVKLPDEKRWIPYKTIQDEANSLRSAAGDPQPKPRVDILDKIQLDKYIVNAIRKRVDDFFPRDDAEELLIGPGLPDAERLEVRAYVLSLGLKLDQRQRDGNSYVVIYSKQDVRSVVEALKRLGGNTLYGKFKLVPKSDCPKHNDVLKTTTMPTHMMNKK